MTRRITGAGAAGQDKKARVSSNDTTSGYLNGKLVAGSGITLTEGNDGGDETLTVAATGAASDEKAKVSSNDTTAGYMNGKLVAGTGVAFTENNDGGNETLTIKVETGPLSALSAVTAATNKLPYFSASNTATTVDFTTTGKRVAAGSSQSFSNANVTINATDVIVYQTGTMSASRTATLPAASAVTAGGEIVVMDKSGTVTATNTIAIARAGSDTINGGTSFAISAAYGIARLVSDGVSAWTASTAQQWDAELSAIAGLTSAANKGIVFTGSGTASTFDLTASGQAIGGVTIAAKGDVITGSGSATVAKTAVGSNGQILSADSSQSGGVKWVTPTGAGGAATDLLWSASASTDYNTQDGDSGHGVTVSWATLSGDVAASGYSLVMSGGANGKMLCVVLDGSTGPTMPSTKRGVLKFQLGQTTASSIRPIVGFYQDKTRCWWLGSTGGTPTSLDAFYRNDSTTLQTISLGATFTLNTATGASGDVVCEFELVDPVTSVSQPDLRFVTLTPYARPRLQSVDVAALTGTNWRDGGAWKFMIGAYGIGGTGSTTYVRNLQLFKHPKDR